MADLVSIYEYIAKDSQRYALSVIDRLTKRTIQIGLFPFSGESVPEYRNQQIREVIEYSYRLIGPLAFYFALYRGLRPRQRVYQPSGLRTISEANQ